MEDSSAVKAWLDWCRAHSHAKCVEYDVPASILPKNYTGVLIDVKVGLKGKNKRVPDDKIYLAHEDLRDKVARGNCVLELNKLENGKIIGTKYMMLIFALKKFSGGLGDEDDSDCRQSEYMHYFLKPLSKARKMVATEKANGEAAHISSRKMFGTDYFCIGSKNVHLLARNLDDLAKYSESRFEFARRIGQTFFVNYMDNPGISKEQKQSFFSFIQENQFSTVLEIIQPENQHVVNLSYLKQPELKFICWTKPDLDDECCGRTTLCPLPIDEALEKARDFGLTTVDYETIYLKRDSEMINKIEKYMEKIRGEYGHEGKVLYFLDQENATIGLIKKKTAWYIILRALREKVAGFLSRKSATLSDLCSRISKRINEIQKWIGFSDAYKEGWIKISTSFARWLNQHKTLTGIRSNFPVIFEQFLNENTILKLEYESLCSSFTVAEAE